MKLVSDIIQGYNSRNSVDQLHVQKISPHPDLTPYIRHYILGKWLISARGHVSVDLFPNNCIEIIILHGKNYIIPDSAGSGIKLSSCLSGLFESAFRKRIKIVIDDKLFRWTMVVLTPAGFSLLFGMDSRKMVNRIWNLNSISSDYSEILPCLLESVPDQMIRKYLLDDFFTDKFRCRRHKADPKLELLESHITRLNGSCSIPLLSDKLCVSYRTLERIFCDKIGLNAQEYFKIDRFMKVFRCLSSQDIFDYSDLIEAGGYFDQAHLIRDFRKVTGLTPKQYHNLAGANFYPERPVLPLS